MNSKTQSQAHRNGQTPSTRKGLATQKAGAAAAATDRSQSSEVVPPKTIIIKPPLPAPQPLHPTQRPQPRPGCCVIKLGLDVDLQRITTAIQYDHSAIKPAAGLDVKTLVQWIEQRVKEGHVVWTVYEACGFGFTLHRKLVAAGAISLVIAPVTLNTQRRLKTDGVDARELCTRLTRYVDGQKTELAVIRIPTPEEEQRRETGRQRDFWQREVLRLSAHGRALRQAHEHETLPKHWWGPRLWKAVSKSVSPVVLGFLTPVREQLLNCEQQVDLLSAELEGRVEGQVLPLGLGALTVALFDGEVCDAARFGNRKAVGSYTGCCPSQYTSGGEERFGPIDRHGNKRLRMILVQAVWRLLRYQRHWHAYKKYAAQLAAGKACRKKAVIALSRLLAIDIWRVRTGRATWIELGLFPK